MSADTERSLPESTGREWVPAQLLHESGTMLVPSRHSSDAWVRNISLENLPPRYRKVGAKFMAMYTDCEQLPWDDLSYNGTHWIARPPVNADEVAQLAAWCAPDEEDADCA